MPPGRVAAPHRPRPAARSPAGRQEPPLRLWAISDLHLSHRANREVFESFPAHPGDWLLVAGDTGDGWKRLDACLEHLAGKYRQVVWVPGNHDLWSAAAGEGSGEPRGEALYQRLVAIARRHRVITPEDPWPVFPHPDGDLLIVPLFLLYDYSFRPAGVRREDVIAWARERRSVCADEVFLHPAPHADRAAWCAARCRQAAARLAAAPALPKVLVNHFPLRAELAVVPRAPRFSPWCGTVRTRDWHRRFAAAAVLYGHLHRRGTQWIDGVPFQEVSLGYPGQWDSARGIGACLHEVEFARRGGADAGG